MAPQAFIVPPLMGFDNEIDDDLPPEDALPPCPPSAAEPETLDVELTDEDNDVPPGDSTPEELLSRSDLASAWMTERMARLSLEEEMGKNREQQRALEEAALRLRLSLATAEEAKRQALQGERMASARLREATEELQKWKTNAQQQYEAVRRQTAIAELNCCSGGVESLSDATAMWCVENQQKLGKEEAYRLVGLPPDERGRVDDIAAHARKMLARVHPDRTPIPACKETLKRRFQLAAHARSLLT
eukprot:Sspe_Gene.106631::Locus_84705_Transcript_1_1_Confidence_1.000_Length_915::g.106631::m.106631